MVEKAVDVKIITSELMRRINEDSRRIRLLEQRMDRIDDSFSSLEDRALNQLDDLKLGIERLSDKILKLTDKLNGIENEIAKVNKELSKTASKAELKQLETFVNIVNPITSKFVTKDELERRLEEKIEKPKRA